LDEDLKNKKNRIEQLEKNQKGLEKDKQVLQSNVTTLTNSEADLKIKNKQLKQDNSNWNEKK